MFYICSCCGETGANRLRKTVLWYQMVQPILETHMVRPKGKKPTVRLSVNLDPADHAELTRLAAQHDLSLAWMVRKAVSEFVERNANHDQPALPLHRGGGRGASA